MDNQQAKIYLAPMAGVTDAAMRGLCAAQGAQITFTEMVSAKGLSYQNQRTASLLRLSPEEKQVGVQLFGREPELLARITAGLCEDLGSRLAVVDINMGCPAPKVVRNGEGCALMNEPELAGKIISAVKKASAVPVSVKFRKGMDDAHLCAVDFAKMAEDAGADMVTVHGRTRAQYYSGQADWEMIAAVKQAVTVKVVGNGDIFTAQDAARMLAQTGCDGVMVARGAQGNPFLFAQIAELLFEGKVTTFPTKEERIETCLRHAQISMEQKGERIAIREMRTHAPHYLKGMPGAAKIRADLTKVEIYMQLEKILLDYLKK